MTEPEDARGKTPLPVVRKSSLKEIAFLFLKLGSIAFGGPAAHIAMMEAEVVRRRRWLSRWEFLDLLGATNLIPGPNSTELAIHIGHRQAGWPGLLVGGSCFILPAVFIVSAFAWAYAHYGSLPEVAGILHGVKPVMIAIILQALWGLGRSALKTRFLGMVAVAGVALSFLRIHELLILLGCGMGVALQAGIISRKRGPGLASFFSGSPLALASTGGVAGSVTTTVSFSLWPLFLFFLKVGSVLFGSGYVLLAFLHADLVDRWHWLSESQLLDAIAIGQATPGPVFTTATFIGYVLGGAPGATVATLGIFLPAFLFVAASGPLVPRLRRSLTAGAFLDGVNAASLALMTVVTWQLARATLIDPMSVLLLAVSLILLARFHFNTTWLVLGGALVGLLARGIRPI